MKYLSLLLLTACTTQVAEYHHGDMVRNVVDRRVGIVLRVDCQAECKYVVKHPVSYLAEATAEEVLTGAEIERME